MKQFFLISILDTMLAMVRQRGGQAKHFNGYLGNKDAFAQSLDGDLRCYTLRGDSNRKIWMNGEHVASALTW